MSALAIGSGLLSRLGTKLREAGLGGRVFLVSDDRVFPRWGEAAVDGLRAGGYSVCSYQLPAGELTKSLSSTYLLYDWLVEHRAERVDTILALGGGVVGDVTGFVAATFLRGVPFVQVPTTVLAQVDSSIGGKVGVNHPKGKNLIGAFYPARLIVGDTDILRTLPRRDIASGWAEAVKCGLILDAELFDVLDANAAGLCDLSSSMVPTMIERCAQHKVRIVEEDEREADRRRILNYGHTIGQALEAALDYEVLLHGEAVSIGMTGAANIAVRVGLLDQSAADRQSAVLAHFGLPIRFPIDTTPPPVDTIVERMTRDKKSRGSQLHWILLDRIGHARIESGIPMDLVADVVEKLL